jgi:hypothetical protein
MDVEFIKERILFLFWSREREFHWMDYAKSAWSRGRLRHGNWIICIQKSALLTRPAKLSIRAFTDNTLLALSQSLSFISWNLVHFSTFEHIASFYTFKFQISGHSSADQQPYKLAWNKGFNSLNRGKLF